MQDHYKRPVAEPSAQSRVVAAWPGRGPVAGIAALFVVGAVVMQSWMQDSPLRALLRSDLPKALTFLGQTSQTLATDPESPSRPSTTSGSAALIPASAALAAVGAATPPDGPGRQPWHAPDVPRRAHANRVERWRPLVREMLAEAWMEGRLDGHAARLDDDLILSLIQQESGGNPNAVSWAGALGLMQVMPFTFAEMHHGSKELGDQIELGTMLDVTSNMRAGIRYLALAMQTHEGNFYWAVASYNAGIEAVEDWRAVGLYAVPPMGGYDETAHYAQVVMHTYLAHRPDVLFRIPDAMPPDHVPGAVRLLKDAGRW